MAILVSTVQDKVQRRFPDLTDTIALEYINSIHADICRQLPMVTAVEDVSVTAETQEYALNAADIRVLQVEWVTDATDGGRVTLEATDKDYLNSENKNWRRRGSGTPHEFYITKSGGYYLGLLPKPNVTTSGGYPVARCHVTRVETLVGGSSLPAGLLTYDAYVYGAQMRFAMDNREYAGEVAGLKAMYEQAVMIERKAFDNISPYKRQYGMRGMNMGGR